MYLYDTDGKEYLDFYAGVAVTSLGHADPDWVAAITEQASKVAHISNLFYNEVAGRCAGCSAATASELVVLALTRVPSIVARGLGCRRLADRICEKSFAEQVFFCNSGTEANEGAIKFARKWGKTLDPSGRKHRLVSFKGGFHGRTMGALSLTANPKYQVQTITGGRRGQGRHGAR